MNLAERLQVELSALASTGRKTLRIDALLRFLDSLDEFGPDTPADRVDDNSLLHYQATADLQKEQYRGEIAVSLAAYESSNAGARTAIRSAMIVNGGAAVAMLAFVGKVWGKDLSPSTASAITLSILWYAGGVGLSAVASGVAWIANEAASRSSFRANSAKCDRVNALAAWATVVLIAVALGAFLGGTLSAYRGFGSHFEQAAEGESGAADLVER